MKTTITAVRQLLSLDESAAITFSVLPSGDYLLENGTVLKRSDVEAKEKEVLAAEIALFSSVAYKLEQLRAERNQLLSECDWTQLPDAPVNKEAWATYRQALSDLPQSALAVTDPGAVVFPTKPTA